MALGDDALRWKALVAGLYQMARNKETLGDSRLRIKLDEYQKKTRTVEELGRLLEDNIMGLELMLEGDSAQRGRQYKIPLRIVE